MLALSSIALAAILLIGYRLDLFVLPGRMREVERLFEDFRTGENRLQEEIEKHRDRGDEIVRLHWARKKSLDRSVADLIRLQRPDFGGGDFRIESVRTHEGGKAFVVGYHDNESYVEEAGFIWGLRTIAINSRGRLLGEDIQVPRWDNSQCFGQGLSKVAAEGGGPDVILVSGDVGYSFSVDARGIVPRGALPAVSNSQPERDGPRLSSGISAEVRHWLAGLRGPIAMPDRMAALLGSSGTGDLFRALHEIERAGAPASRLAVPLLSHPDPDLRARAAAVVGNDEALWEEIEPLVHDHVPAAMSGGAQTVPPWWPGRRRVS